MEATPTAPEVAKDVEKEKKPTPFLTLWLDESGNLKFKSQGLNVFEMLGITGAAKVKLEGIIIGEGPKQAVPEPPSESQPG